MRFFLGIGLGAEYPCGSVSASEQSEEKVINKNAWHRWLALATNTMIDFGFVIAAFTPLVLFWIFGNDHLRAVWRLSLGLGVVPALAVFIWRLKMDEPLRYKKDSMKNTRIPYKLVFKRYWRSLAAISAVWFLYDMIVYPFGIYSSTIVNNVTGQSTDLSVVFGWNVIIKLTEHIAAFAVLYGIFLSFGEFGPGNCTFILASKSCPTGVRGQYFGVAAATGKIGAFVGTWVFPPIIKGQSFGGADTLRGNTGPFWIGSGVALLSALITLVFIKPLTPEGMEKEDRDFREYLESQGFDTSGMGLFDINRTDAELEVDDLQVDEARVSISKEA
ncbi:hypothetical protein DXG01_015579 [Tephrocybe rancida]|nr:hypothetical protein DXG01_015579 [Tephrocybe rancida]